MVGKGKISLVILVPMILLSCGKVKENLQQKAADVLEEKARDAGLNISSDDLKDSISQGLGEKALEGVLEPGVESLTEQLESAFSEEALEEMAESLGALEGAFETDAEGNIINMHLEDEGMELNLDGSTPWPEAIPSRIPQYQDGLIFTTQVEEGESVMAVIAMTSQEKALAYVNQLKEIFDTVFEVYEEDWVYVGATEKDGIVLAYDDESIILQYYMNTDFLDSWKVD